MMLPADHDLTLTPKTSRLISGADLRRNLANEHAETSGVYGDAELDEMADRLSALAGLLFRMSCRKLRDPSIKSNRKILDFRDAGPS